MNENIKFWRGKRVEHLSMDELREAIAELYRENEQLSWLVHQQRQIIERGAKGKKGKAKLAEIVDEEEDALAA